jgi:FKBP-type peptidyl-prolyl cis-trans isomerase
MFLSPDRYIQYFIFALFIFLIGCSKDKYTKYNDDYSYALLHKSKNTDDISKDLLIIYQLKLSKKSDSIFWDSKYFTENGFCSIENTGATRTKNAFEDLLCHYFSLGDSLALRTNANCIFRDFFKQPLPYFLSSNDTITAFLYIDTAIQKKDIDNYTSTFVTQNNALTEKKAIQAYISANGKVYQYHNGIYINTIYNGGGAFIKKGEHLSVVYHGYFLDGTNCDNNGTKPVDFEYGEQSQLLPGLMRAIATAHFGDSLSVIIPSSLAYGEEGNSSGFIKPYTPLVYQMSVKKAD